MSSLIKKFGIDKTYSISRREILNKKVTEIFPVLSKIYPFNDESPIFKA
jgi:hypothetical protein